MVSCFGFKCPFRQYFSLYWTASQRKRGKEERNDIFILLYPITLEGRQGTTDDFATIHFPLFFYAPPQKVAGYYVIPSELSSVCPSVCPSVLRPSVRLSVRPSVRPSAVDHSCPLYNFDTVQDNFTKLGTNVKHDRTTCRD